MRILCFFIMFLVLTWGFSGFSENRPLSYDPPLQAIRKMAPSEEGGQQLLNELEELDKSLHALYSKVENLSIQIRELEAERIEVRQKLKQTQEKLESNREKARARLAALYKFRQMSYTAPLFAVEDFRTAIEAGYIVAKLIANDHRFFAGFRDKIATARSLEKALSEKGEELRVLSAQLETQQQQLLGTKEREIQLLVKIREKIEQHDVSEEPASTLEEVFIPEQTPQEERSASQEEFSEPSPSKSFSVQRGTLPLPTEGILRKSNRAKTNSPYPTVLHDDGIIIEAPKGQPIQAIHEGVVVFAKWLKYYGRVMVIDHGEHYHTVIAHADQLLKKAGERVKPGEKVATVGDTGSQGRPKLYFEIRHRGQPIDPTKWLAVH
jgi:septal ring factor EnvC (AmiA/AmiB activator)